MKYKVLSARFMVSFWNKKSQSSRLNVGKCVFNFKMSEIGSFLS